MNEHTLCDLFDDEQRFIMRAPFWAIGYYEQWRSPKDILCRISGQLKEQAHAEVYHRGGKTYIRIAPDQQAPSF